MVAPSVSAANGRKGNQQGNSSSSKGSAQRRLSSSSTHAFGQSTVPPSAESLMRRTSVDAATGSSMMSAQPASGHLPPRMTAARTLPPRYEAHDAAFAVPSSSATKLDAPAVMSTASSPSSNTMRLNGVGGFSGTAILSPQGSQAVSSTSHLGAQAHASIPYQSVSTNGQHQLRHPPSPLAFPATFLAQQQQVQQAQLAVDRYTADLTNYVIAFLSPILPTEEEYRIKEATRRQLERLAGRVSPGARLLAFGSMANGFALKNSDMDLCCLLPSSNGEKDGPAQDFNAAELVEVLGGVIREETDFNVMPLPKARIPIIKISRPPTSDLPYDISCDIGFENRLALENTRLLLSYAMVDPPRLRTLVLFLKVWTKRRKLNSPFTGTLSSYGYTLMMLYFLIHVKRPAVLPNLQRISPSSGSTSKPLDAKLNGHDIYFYDDVATLRREWTSQNTENVGELLLEFFRYFSKEFSYSRDVISIRTEQGSVTKESKAWTSELCIEDPFQAGYNVARTVTKDGLYTIRGEFMRASRILTTRIDRVSAALAELCEEREDGLTRAPSPSYHNRHRMSYAAGNHSPHIYLPGGGFDPRYLRDVTRRFDAQAPRNGIGGSFAFEEMAKGLAQAQKGPAVAFPPTAAMLAPLTQNPGLNPHQSLMRAGLRYDATPNQVSTSGSTPAPRVPSSARSEDGGGASYERRRGKRSGTTPNSRLATLPTPVAADRGGIPSRGAASSRTSPVLDHATPQNLLHPTSSLHGAYGIGEAFAYGSEISFGSQRFQLHPPTSASSIQAAELQHGAQQRASRSFSDGVNRSKSVPRPILDGSVDGLRRTSTPMLSEPPSPTRCAAQAPSSLPAETSVVAALDPSLASLSLRTSGRTSTSSQRTASSRSSLSGVGSHKSQPEMATNAKEFAVDSLEMADSPGLMRRSASAQRQSLRAPVARQSHVTPSAITTPSSRLAVVDGQGLGDAGPVMGTTSLTTPFPFDNKAGAVMDPAGPPDSEADALSAPANYADNINTPYQTFHFADDSRSDLSEETLDELARASIMESSEGEDGEDFSHSVGYPEHTIEDCTHAQPDASPDNTKVGDREDDVRSWAAAQRVQVISQHEDVAKEQRVSESQ